MRFYKTKYKTQLQNKGYAKTTIDSYVRSLELYERWCRTKQNNKSETASQLAFKYLKFIKRKSNKSSTINGAIYPLKLYYKFFSKNNPFEYMYFKREEESIKDNGFTKIELEDIYDKYPQRTLTEIRDKVLLGFYVFQGIKSKEVKTIEIKDLDLSGYAILLKGDTKTNQRKIGLNIKQIILLSDYINIHRKQLLNNIETETLIVTSKSINCIEGIIWQLSKKLKKEVYGFENFHQIRKSVISHWIEKYDLRMVQYLSGHKYISSTEKFIVKDIKELQRELNSYFPLN